MSCTKCDVWRTQINLSVLSHCSKNTQAHAFPFEFLTSHKWRVDVGCWCCCCCHTPLDGCCRVQWEGLFAAVASHNVLWGTGASNMKTPEQTDLSQRVVQVQVSDQWTEKRSHHHFIVWISIPLDHFNKQGVSVHSYCIVLESISSVFWMNNFFHTHSERVRRVMMIMKIEDVQLHIVVDCPKYFLWLQSRPPLLHTMRLIISSFLIVTISATNLQDLYKVLQESKKQYGKFVR